MYYTRARYYSPDLKRFINRDIVTGNIRESQTLNRYAYVNGNPISYIDPFGLSRDPADSDWGWESSSIGFIKDFGGFLGEKASNVFKITMHAASGIKSYNEGYYDDFIQEYKIVQSNLEELKSINVNSFNPFKKVKPLKLDLQFFASKGTGKSLLPGEGKVGTYEELIDAGSRGDNLTPHHMPSQKYMKTNAGIHRNDGVSMNMEQPHPGKGGRHHQTETYGMSGQKLQGYLNLSPRDALARDIWDARIIYKNDGLYTPEIRQGLKEVIDLNKQMYPELFKK